MYSFSGDAVTMEIAGASDSMAQAMAQSQMTDLAPAGGMVSVADGTDVSPTNVASVIEEAGMGIA